MYEQPVIEALLRAIVACIANTNGGDIISAEFGNNIILGDAGEVNLNGPVSNDIFTTNPTVGGADKITGGGDGSNIIIGGALGDIFPPHLAAAHGGR